MPTYEYACQKCGHEFEQFQSMRDEPLRKCPQCKKAGLKRLVGGGAGLIFKGTGFYITDYKKKSGGEPKSGEAKSTGEAKPAAAPAGAAAKPAADSAKK
jgi:putative FmdB family regulatory protein